MGNTVGPRTFPCLPFKFNSIKHSFNYFPDKYFHTHPPFPRCSILDHGTSITITPRVETGVGIWVYVCLSQRTVVVSRIESLYRRVPSLIPDIYGRREDGGGHCMIPRDNGFGLLFGHPFPRSTTPNVSFRMVPCFLSPLLVFRPDLSIRLRWVNKGKTCSLRTPQYNLKQSRRLGRKYSGYS